MYARMKVLDPNKIEVLLQLTATIEEWKRLREQLGSLTSQPKWPASDVAAAIDSMVRKAEAHFLPDRQPEEPVGDRVRKP
ncbi:hypothetical protein KKH23_11130 [Patescibacteria group bacterium]|nr:hypothetical protein [Patescibacteria group bacterium]